VDDIKMDLKEVGAWTEVDLAHDMDKQRALVNVVMNL
jgi:hypothetical protein